MRLVAVGPILHPRHGKLFAAVLTHHREKVIYGVSEPRAELAAMLDARNILMMMTKYRDIAKYPGKGFK